MYGFPENRQNTVRKILFQVRLFVYWKFEVMRVWLLTLKRSVYHLKIKKRMYRENCSLKRIFP